MLFKSLIGAAAALLALAAAPLAQAETISGAGSSFAYPILSKWSGSYTGGSKLNYQSIGSGAGIAQIKAKTVTFGASDMPLKVAELNKFGLTQFPVIVGGVTVVVNVKGVKAGQLTLDGDTMANIYMGKITKWNDPAIKALNPGVNLPAQAIAVVHRADASGTTFIVSNYLSKVSGEWAKSVGAATSVEWPTGIGAKGNEGVAGNVAQTPGSIGYVEYAYALQNKLIFTKMKNKDGNVVAPNVDTFGAAAAGADWAGAASQAFNMVLVNQPGAQAWPITGATWVIMYKQPQNPAASASALKFFKWSYEKGGAAARALDYVPLPPEAVKAIESSWGQIAGSGM